jgi:hypothetical protein
MTLQIYDSASVDRTISALEVYDEGAVNRILSEVWVYDSNLVDRLVFTTASPLTAVAIPDEVSGVTVGTGTATSDATTATPSGGFPPYTYLWSLVSYTGTVPPSATTPNADTTNFVQTSIPKFATRSSVWNCAVTDSMGQTTSCTCNATFEDQS